MDAASWLISVTIVPPICVSRAYLLATRDSGRFGFGLYSSLSCKTRAEVARIQWVSCVKGWSQGGLCLKDMGSSRKRNRVFATPEVGQKDTGKEWDYQTYQALLHGGEEVANLMKKMAQLLEEITGMDADAEQAAVEIAANAAVGQCVDRLDGSFLMALDWMINQADADHDDKHKSLLEVIKDTVLSQLAQKSPSHVQVIGLLCSTPSKEHRQDILRRAAGGGGAFDKESGGKLFLPSANLNDIASQADDILTTMEEKSRIADRKLLAKLVLVREEAHSMMGGGILDERNDNRGLNNLPECEVSFLSKIISLQPGPALRERLSGVLHGKEEGADLAVQDNDIEKGTITPNSKQQGHHQMENIRPFPVRPGLFLYTVTKVLGGMYKKNVSGVTVQQLEWIHRQTLQILQEMAFS